jgi:preprotein translocase subunit YajC
MDAFAQGGAAAPAGNPGVAMVVQFLPIIAIMVIMYFLIIRPQQQKQKQLDSMLKALKKGDRVLTSGGILGTVVGLDEAKAVLKIADDTKVEFMKSAIVQVIPETK